MTHIEKSYLICTYLIISDEEIHSNEISLLNILYCDIDDKIVEEHKKVLSDSDEKISLNTLINSISMEIYAHKRSLVENLYRIAYSDSYFHKKERDFIDKIEEKLNTKLNTDELRVLVESTKKSIILYEEKEISWQNKLREVFTAVLYEIHDNDEKYEGDLLQGKRFVKKVIEIGRKAKKDLQLVEKSLKLLNNSFSKSLNELDFSIESFKLLKESEEKKRILSLSNSINKRLRDSLVDCLQKNIDVIEKKEKTIDFFTIAFMGRTKAGKSTFHKIITNEDNDDIGKGQTRTTRYNRVFNWENIRIIDTPGIGAPGGKKDTEIARGIVDEADLVCYLVTNDSIQETEFDFLCELKEKNKPLFIILNCKENLSHDIRLKRFIKNPLQWKLGEGEKSIQGHIDRINEMVQRNGYNPDLIQIIPIQLLAAKLAVNPNYLKESVELKNGSNIYEYTQKVKKTIFKNGHLSKSQSIVDGTNFYINEAHNTCKTQLEAVKKMKEEFNKSKISIRNFIEKESKSTRVLLEADVKSIFTKMKGDIVLFANNNYQSKDLGKDWNTFVKENRYFEDLTDSIQLKIEKFENDLEEKIQEQFDDFRINLEYSQKGQFLNSVDVTNYKFAFQMLFGGTTIVLGVLALVNILNPAGWFVLVLGLCSGLINLLCKSKKKKIKEAQEKIVKELGESVDQNKDVLQNELFSNFDRIIDERKKSLNQNFNMMIEGLDSVISNITLLSSDIENSKEMLNRYFVFRILQQIEYFDEDSEFNPIEDLREIKILRDYKKGSVNIIGNVKIKKELQDLVEKQLQLKLIINTY